MKVIHTPPILTLPPISTTILSQPPLCTTNNNNNNNNSHSNNITDTATITTTTLPALLHLPITSPLKQNLTNVNKRDYDLMSENPITIYIHLVLLQQIQLILFGK
ncbi:unnamed protein product [Cunninghamella echinulata]